MQWLLFNTDYAADAVVDEAGLDIILDPTGELERCLSTALTKAELRTLANFAPVSDAHDKQAVRELCAMWDMDHMLHGMSQVQQHSGPPPHLPLLPLPDPTPPSPFPCYTEIGPRAACVNHKLIFIATQQHDLLFPFDGSALMLLQMQACIHHTQQTAAVLAVVLRHLL